MQRLAAVGDGATSRRIPGHKLARAAAMITYLNRAPYARRSSRWRHANTRYIYRANYTEFQLNAFAYTWLFTRLMALDLRRVISFRFYLMLFHVAYLSLSYVRAVAVATAGIH